jgi:uncharacterized membrane protein
MKKAAVAIAVLAFIGMVDAFYISLKRGAGPIECHVTRGCQDVLTSPYSTFAGIPISWFGLAFYIAAFGSAVFQASGSANTLRFVFWLAFAAFAVSLLLTSIQAFVLHSYCEYCLLSAALVTAIFVISAAQKTNQA